MSVSTDRPLLDIDEVNLDAMTTEDLLRERAEVAAAIPMITAQLQDKDRRPPMPEDDSPAWEAYRDWRRRARWALAHHQRDLVTIKAVLTERKDTGTVGNALRLAEKVAAIERGEAEPTEHDLLNIERARRIREALATTTDAGLLLRAYRIIRHLTADYVNTLPDALDASDREALFMLGTHLRKAYGGGRVAAFVSNSTGEAP